ncbi:MAG TPA: MMPL family transporter [Feifaniaceae bacterium]|nr:MMPL family transporter [Feifaniaceae bacterium]
MTEAANFIIKHKKLVIVVFLAAALVSAALFPFVTVNYNMADYLPPNAQSTTALNIMNREFTQAIPNASVMVKGVSVMEAMAYKQKLASINGVSEVLWLDDAADIKKPLEMSDADTVESFYKNGNALFSVTIKKGMEKETTEAIQQMIGEDNSVAGEAPDIATVQQATGTEVLNAVGILLPAIIIILVLSTTSWIEPLLFLAAIGISIVINMGTNVFLGKISFMTNSVSPILQLACSLDYAIFLLHSFESNRKKYGDVNEAMRHSIKESMSTVAASAATTVFGFLALMFMNFQIGADLGINLAKGILTSFISVMVFLPALTLCIYKWIDRTKHKELTPSFHNVHKIITKLAVPVLIIIGLCIVPTFLGQSRTAFTYGNGSADPTSRTGRDSAAIKNEFGQSTVMVLLVPRGDVVKEQTLCAELEKTEHVTGVVSYAANVGAAIPPEYLDKSITEQFYSENYARIIVYTDTPEEGDAAFTTVEAIQGKARDLYGDAAYSVGQSANLYDMKNLVQVDNTRVNLIAVIAIFLVLVVTFRSATLPFLLLLTIETGIWINLSIPYFSGEPINFIGYLVISTVQLGATVDYAILLTNHYVRSRRELPQREAIREAVGGTFKSILVSAMTLTSAGFTLYLTSSNPVISGLGLLLGRGTLLSMLMVTCFLPAMLTLFDRAIGRTTFRAGFLGRAPRSREL